MDECGFLPSLFRRVPFSVLSQDVQPSSVTGKLVPFGSNSAPADKPNKGKGGTLSNGKGKGSGANQSGHHRHAPEIVWAEGPDEAPMPAVEMQFDDHYNDYNAAEPPVELPEISEGAICKRMWRMFRPRHDGSYLVPESVVREYTDINTRPNVARAFERCGYSVVPSQHVSVYVTKLISTKTLAAQDKFVKMVNKTLEDEEEVSIQEDWEFLTEEEMQDANWSENLA